jgi:hypothetical protein
MENKQIYSKTVSENPPEFIAIDSRFIEDLNDIEVVKKLLINLSKENFNLRKKIVDLYLKNGVVE